MVAREISQLIRFVVVFQADRTEGIVLIWNELRREDSLSAEAVDRLLRKTFGVRDELISAPVEEEAAAED